MSTTPYIKKVPPNFISKKILQLSTNKGKNLFTNFYMHYIFQKVPMGRKEEMSENVLYSTFFSKKIFHLIPIIIDLIFEDKKKKDFITN
jgi:hypothetical protein